MKNYQAIAKKNTKGLLRISLVKEPAIKEELIFLENEEGEVLKFVNEEKREITAPVLIPNKLIFRKDIEGESANIYFSGETIKELHIQGCKNGYEGKINLNHEEMNVDGVFCFETWIIQDPLNDKSNAMGFNLQKDTLMKSYKIENEEVWERTKNKELKGLSIEVLTEDLEFKEKNNTKIKMKKDKKTILEHIKSLFSSENSKEYSKGFFGESLEEGSIITDAEGNPKVEVDFDFEGKKYITDEIGAIKEVKEIMEDLPVKKEDEEVEVLKSKIAELEKENADLKESITAEKNGVEKLKSEIGDLKKIENNLPIKNPLEKMSNYEKLLANEKRRR